MHTTNKFRQEWQSGRMDAVSQFLFFRIDIIIFRHQSLEMELFVLTMPFFPGHHLYVGICAGGKSFELLLITVLWSERSTRTYKSKEHDYIHTMNHCALHTRILAICEERFSEEKTVSFQIGGPKLCFILLMLMRHLCRRCSFAWYYANNRHILHALDSLALFHIC